MPSGASSGRWLRRPRGGRAEPQGTLAAGAQPLAGSGRCRAVSRMRARFCCRRQDVSAETSSIDFTCELSLNPSDIDLFIMKYKNLGNTGLQVSPLCLGCMTYGVPERGDHPWTLPENQSRPLIRKAIDLGINFFDTANAYSDGTSEEIVGQALKDYSAPRRGRDRHQGVLPDEPRAERRWVVAQSHLHRDRRELAPARHGLRRSVSNSPLGPSHADRGNPRSAARPGEVGQGALPGRLLHVRLAIQQSPAPRPPARMDARSSACRICTT